MDLARRAAKFKSAARKLGPRGRGRRYPESLKREALEYLELRRQDGRGIESSAAELDLPPATLERWAATPRPSRAPAFVPLMVVASAEAPAPSRIVVHAPAGVRIEGLDIASLADLVRRLA